LKDADADITTDCVVDIFIFFFRGTVYAAKSRDTVYSRRCKT
jgi:hypothetical protein